MLPIFAIAMFLSAALLFAVQPIVGKMVLPTLGGSPAVWNTCMVFFQALLLAGYTYAHLLTKYFSLKVQMAIQAIVLIAAAIALPIALPQTLPARFDLSGLPAGETISIIFWLIGILCITAGAPFLVLSTSAPLLQSWFARTSHPQAKDPYFLYAASNAGSILGLIAYPLVIEPLLGISDQSKYWGIAYFTLLACLACAAFLAIRNYSPAPQSDHTSAAEITAAPTRKTKLRWIALAAVPSSVSLGVTQYISTDIAAAPLLWVVPLLLYLLSFIFAFSKRGVNIKRWSWILAGAATVVAFLILSNARNPIALVLSLHLLVLFAAAMVCHGQLAAERPSTRYLTGFYLLMSLGGMIGGIINAIIAPVVLPIVLEYPLAVVASLVLAPISPAAIKLAIDRINAIFTAGHAVETKVADTSTRPMTRIQVGFLLLGLILSLLLAEFFVNAMRLTSSALVSFIMFGIPAMLCFGILLLRQHQTFTLALLIMFLYEPIRSQFGERQTIHTERTFFGMHRVTTSKDDAFRTLYHGTTIHGIEARYLLPHIRPATYFHPTGPIGQLLTEDALGSRLNSIAVIGLGAGSIALYNEDGCTMDFYEIDSAVIRIATDETLFNYLSPKYTRGTINIKLGDGRLELAKAPDHSYGIIVIDAFSSDAIPTHLLTREAVAMYRRKLRPGGLLIAHISNVFFDLKPVIAALASDAGLTARMRHDIASPTDRQKEAKSDSIWCVLSAKDSDLGPIALDPNWQVLHRSPSDPLWTDDYSNVLKVLNWR